MQREMVLCRRCGASVEHDIDEHEHEDGELNDQPSPSTDSPVAAVPAAKAKPDETPNGGSGNPSQAPRERRPRTEPSDLVSRAQRLIVRRAILCQVPGISRVRAEAIVGQFPTISALMEASVNELEAIPIKKSKLGRELAIALKRVFE